MPTKYIPTEWESGDLITAELLNKMEEGIANQQVGPQGEKGDPFSISKTYPSVAAMNEGFATDGLPVGSYVMISSTVDDPDNAKLYVKGNASYEYVMDMSGAEGEKGDTGSAGTITLGTVTTGEPGTDVIITNTGTASAAIFNFTIPRGDKGETGPAGTDGTTPTIAVGETITAEAGTPASVSASNEDTTTTFTFTIPKGDKGDQGIQGEPGTPGTNASVSVGETVTGAPGTSALVENTGDETNMVLKFTIPQGVQGTPGTNGKDAPSFSIGDVATLDTGEPATVTNTASEETEFIFSFGLPRGEKGEPGTDGVSPTISIGEVTTVESNENAEVTNSGDSTNIVLDFKLPKGIQGPQGDPGADGANGTDGITPTFTVGTVSTLEPGEQATVVNSGEGTNIVLDFGIPKGLAGANGTDGAAGNDGAPGKNATITVGTVTTGDPGTEASVENVGTETNAILNFTIPRGNDGADGDAQIPNIVVGNVTTVAAGEDATVTADTEGTTVTLNFGIPQGIQGEPGKDAADVDVEAIYTAIDAKQDQLTAGTGISIEDNVISTNIDLSLFVLVAELPAEGIQTNKVYLVPSDEDGENNIYTEYVYLNNQWEILGQYKSDVDLSEYAKKNELPDQKQLEILFNFPLRVLQDRVYTQDEIFKWFGCTDAIALKNLILDNGQMYMQYGISLSGNPMYYKMPIQYTAFESANQVKLVAVGLNTHDDTPARYEIIINLDGTIIEGNSNVKVTMEALVPESEIPAATTSTLGGVRQMPLMEDVLTETVPVETFNQLIQNLKNAGIMQSMIIS